MLGIPSTNAALPITSLVRDKAFLEAGKVEKIKFLESGVR